VGRWFVYITSFASLMVLTLIYVAVTVGAGLGASASPSPEPIGTLEISAFDLGFEPNSIDVDAAGVYRVTFTNTGELPHDLVFADGSTLIAEPGQSVTEDVTIPASGTTFQCTVPGHADAGMTGTVTVAGVGPSPSEDSHGGPTPSQAIEPDPEAPDYVPRDATAPEPVSRRVHDVELVIEETDLVMADGFVQRAWTFGGTVPGPVIRVKVGDTVRVHLVNSPDNELPHSIDFHASMVAWNDEMTSINPGEEKVYEFVANYAGVWMYHCGTSPALHHIANGMYGMVIVEPEGGLPPVDREFALVQSEWYLGEQGQPASLEKAASATPGPDFVLFNGIANQYLDHPIEVGTGERIRVFVLNAGPSIDSSFHIVGTIFDTVIKEGVALTRGNQGSWGAQAVDLSPAQGAVIEFVLVEDGMYPIVTHAFNFVGRGALGLFQAGDGDPLN